MSKANAEWVLNFLKAHEATGQHAPVETMQRVVDYIVELEAQAGVIKGSEQLARDVMVTAVEGGSGYWARFIGVQRVDNEGFPDHLDIISFQVRPDEPAYSDKREDLRDQFQEITAEKILVAMQQIVRDEKLISPSFQSDVLLALLHDDASDIDADGADAILQVACFGELVFG